MKWGVDGGPGMNLKALILGFIIGAILWGVLYLLAESIWGLTN